MAVIVGTYVFVLPQFANYSEVWAQVKTLSWEWILVLLGAVIFNIVTFAPPWMAALPGLGLLVRADGDAGLDRVDLLAPGGPGGRDRDLRGDALRLGLPRRRGRAGGDADRDLEPARDPRLPDARARAADADRRRPHFAADDRDGRAGGVRRRGRRLCARAVESSEWPAASATSPPEDRQLGRCGCVRRGPVGWNGESLAHFRSQAIGLLRRRWHLLTLATLAGQLSVFLVLLVCLRALGVGAAEVSVVEAFAGWSLARVLGSIPITPGGLGIVEVGLTTVLVGFGGNHAGVVAAVLVYRFLTIVPTLVFGAVAAATWRRQRRAQVAELP